MRLPSHPHGEKARKRYVPGDADLNFNAGSPNTQNHSSAGNDATQTDRFFAVAILCGLTNAEIGDMHGWSPDTVETYLKWPKCELGCEPRKLVRHQFQRLPL